MKLMLFTAAMLFLVSITYGENQQCQKDLCTIDECTCLANMIILRGFLAKARIANIVHAMPEKYTQVIFLYGNKELDNTVFRGKASLKKITSDGNKHENPRAKNFIKITKDAFNGLYNLKELQLKRYNLHTLDEGIFHGLLSVKKIDLSDNSFTEMHPLQKMYAYIPKSALVVYTGNKFQCTCHNDWENIMWAQTYRKGMFKDLKCTNFGKSIYDLNYSIVCSGSVFKSNGILPIVLAFLMWASVD